VNEMMKLPTTNRQLLAEVSWSWMIQIAGNRKLEIGN